MFVYPYRNDTLSLDTHEIIWFPSFIGMFRSGTSVVGRSSTNSSAIFMFRQSHLLVSRALSDAKLLNRKLLKVTTTPSLTACGDTGDDSGDTRDVRHQQDYVIQPVGLQLEFLLVSNTYILFRIRIILMQKA